MRPELASPVVMALVLIGCGVDERVSPLLHLGGTDGAAWSQWGKNSQHGGRIDAVAQAPVRPLATEVFDPFVAAERSDGQGDILLHYQSPLIDGPDVFMEKKSGRRVACDPPGSTTPAGCGSAGWDRQIWGEQRLSWENGELVEKWRVESDWKPPPDAGGLEGWEPLFHAALDGAYLMVPGAGGSVLVVDRGDGVTRARLTPFADLDPDLYVAGPLTVGPDGSVYYDVLALDPFDPWNTDAAGGWLVRVAPDGTPSAATFASLVAGAPLPDDACTGQFALSDLPWPPAPGAKPAPIPCGSQRPGLNAAPAVAPDGTVYVVSRAHFASNYAYLVAVNADLSPRWAASLRDRLDDGCGSALLPATGSPGGCRDGARTGVDPATNEPPAGIVDDLSTASPTVAPDGSVLYGAFTRYNHSRGHLLQFSARGSFLASYDFGWDVTPAVYEHDGGYSVVIKDNHYDGGSYCDDLTACPPAFGGPYSITQLDATLVPEWKFESHNHMSCVRGPDGQVTCTADHPFGFEWCINAPGIDGAGTVFANAEDGVVYAIPQGGVGARSLFLGESIGAAYTPLSLDAEGRIYAENLGTLFVLGE